MTPDHHELSVVCQASQIVCPQKSGPLQPVGVNSYAIEGGESRFDGEQTCRLALIFLICFGGGGVLGFVLFLISPLWFKIMKCVEKKKMSSNTKRGKLN